MKHKLAVFTALATMTAATPALADPFFTPIVVALLESAGLAGATIAGVSVASIISGIAVTAPNGTAQILRRPV